MSASTRPSTHADEAHEALRRLAHATRDLDDPTEIYPILGELTNGLASLAQSLHQIGDFHEGPACMREWGSGDPRTGRAASHQVSWELHRAAEMVHQVAVGIDRAHEVEAKITYAVQVVPAFAPVPRPAPEPRLSL